MFIFGNNYLSAEKTIKYSEAKAKTIAENIANINTPGYKRKDIVGFNDIYQNIQKLKITSEKHLQPLNNDTAFLEIRDNTSSMKEDGNNVDIDREITEMNENVLLQSVAVGELERQIREIKDAINEGRR